MISLVKYQKGGVGKTALSNNLAASLALEGKQVLVADLDSLCTLTKALGYAPEKFDSSVATLITNPSMVGQCIYRTDNRRLFIHTYKMFHHITLIRNRYIHSLNA